MCLPLSYNFTWRVDVYCFAFSSAISALIRYNKIRYNKLRKLKKEKDRHGLRSLVE